LLSFEIPTISNIGGFVKNEREDTGHEPEDKKQNNLLYIIILYSIKLCCFTRIWV